MIRASSISSLRTLRTLTTYQSHNLVYQLFSLKLQVDLLTGIKTYGKRLKEEQMSFGASFRMEFTFKQMVLRTQ
jgi:hypothetical protein